MYLTCQNWKWCHLIKRGTQFSARKGFHIYDLSILISVNANCINSIYADSHMQIVIRYLKR